MTTVTRRTTLGLLAATLTPSVALAAQKEPAFLRDRLDDGSLPQMADRLPKTPRVIDLAAMGRRPGTYGGSIRVLIGNQKDIRFMTINGYARLVGYDQSLTLRPDILEDFEVSEGRIFTFRIREDHRWSDGNYLTSEDFRHYWEDVLNDPDLRPGGLPSELLVEEQRPTFEVLDRFTVRYTWHAPNPSFLPRLAAPQPMTIVLPAHYMRQFHPNYQDADRLAELVAEERVEEWTNLFLRKSRTYRPENPELPVLDPWINTTEPPAERFVFIRNPYYHRVDETGQQLPYVDRFLLNISSASIIAAKAGAGETDLQMSGMDFVDYTFLKASEKIHPITVDLWKKTQGSALALRPNLNCSDDVWRTLFQDVRVRRALSLAIDRHEVNMVSFFGLASESTDTVLPQSPLYKPEYANAYAIYDPDAANALLDEVGLVERNRHGIRILPDGRPMDLIIETSGGSEVETDVLQLVSDTWRGIGIAPFVRVSQRDVFRSRAMGGEVMMSVWGGLDNALPTPNMSPRELAPTADDQLQWPLWGMHYYSRETKGKPPELPEVKELLDLFKQWGQTGDEAEQRAIWHRMLTIHAEQVYSIGIVNAALQPIVYNAALQNVPQGALYGFDPTSYLGVYMPDTFWYEETS